jgi:hypothetical protein
MAKKEKKKDIVTPSRMSSDRLKMVDPEDREILKGKSEMYVMGWNRVKYNQGFKIG